MEQPLTIRKVHRAWSLYDWANSAYNLVITATIFPIYYLAVTGDDRDDTIDYVSFFGWEVINSTLLNYALAFAYMLVAVLSPVLSSIADYQGSKKKYLQLFCFLGATACCGLFFFTPGNLELGILLAILAAIGYSGSFVFYNAYLPEIADPSYQDKLSAQGFAYGYVGSVILQLICLVFVMMEFSDTTFAARLSFLLVGLWWLVFALISFRGLPNSTPIGKDMHHHVLYHGFHELRQVWQHINKMALLKPFLAAFFFYSMGVQTVMLAAAEFAGKEIGKKVDGVWVGLKDSELIIIVLIIQLVAIGGALLMARLSRYLGNIKVLILSVMLWIGICIAAYYTYTADQFYLLAAVVGLVMGGIQSMSRSTFSKMMPETRDTASYFSFFNIAEKLAVAFGLFTFGLVEHITGDMRHAVFALAGFFLVGLIFLMLTERRRILEGINYHLEKPEP